MTVCGVFRYPRQQTARLSLMRGLAHVSTEMSLHVLAYDMKRVISLLGMGENDESNATAGRVRGVRHFSQAHASPSR